MFWLKIGAYLLIYPMFIQFKFALNCIKAIRFIDFVTEHRAPRLVMYRVEYVKSTSTWCLLLIDFDCVVEEFMSASSHFLFAFFCREYGFDNKIKLQIQTEIKFLWPTDCTLYTIKWFELYAMNQSHIPHTISIRV